MSDLLSAFTCSPLPWPHWLAPDGSVLLVNADCREALATMRDGSVPAVVSDPPYGIGVEYGDPGLTEHSRHLRLAAGNRASDAKHDHRAAKMLAAIWFRSFSLTTGRAPNHL